MLEESVESFLRQDYKGSMELVILNDREDQKIQCDIENIVVINKETRYKSLGEKRNEAAKIARNDVLITWGDDDIHLPGRVTRLIKGITEANADMCREGAYLYMNGPYLREIPTSPSGSMAIKKSFYLSIGGCPDMNSGEDQALLKRAYKHGKVVECKDKNPQFIYRWGTGHYHISGLGADKNNQKSGWEKTKELIDKKIKNGTEPSGVLKIMPHWKKDYIQMAATPYTRTGNILVPAHMAHLITGPKQPA